jgi:oligopeptide transport system permease protein
MAVTAPARVSEGLEFGLRKERSLWGDAWRRLRRNKAAVTSMIVIVTLALLAIFAPLLAKDPTLRAVPNNSYRQPVWRTTNNPRTTGTWKYPLGTDSIGRDLLTKLVYGGRTSLMVGLVPTVLTVGIGILIGMIAGFAGGRTDNFLMRFTDVIYAFPDLLFIIIMMSAFRDSALGRPFGGLILMFVALSIISWTGMARLIRGQVLSLKEKEFVEAARAIGTSRTRIMTRHLLPNVLTPVIVAITFGIPGAIIGEAALGFLGVGMRPPTPGTYSAFPTSWGVLIQEGQIALNTAPWILIFSAIVIGLTTMSFTFLGDGLRDALDPRQKH